MELERGRARRWCRWRHRVTEVSQGGEVPWSLRAVLSGIAEPS